MPTEPYSAALQLTDFVIEAADKGLVSNSMMIDQSAEFDCINAKNLDRKLQLYNFFD